MVTNVTSLSGNGLRDWLIQRATSVYFAGYSLFLLGYLIAHPKLQFHQWHNLFYNIFFQVASVIALAMLSLHAWIGIWTVTTDYLKPLIIRLSVQILVAFLLMAQFAWGIKILWGQ